VYFYQPDTLRDELVILALTELAERYGVRLENGKYPTLKLYFVQATIH